MSDVNTTTGTMAVPFSAKVGYTAAGVIDTDTGFLANVSDGWAAYDLPEVVAARKTARAATTASINAWALAKASKG